jgi:hypothetical protein
MGYLEYILFFAFVIGVCLLSFLLDHMWASILPSRIIHRIFVTPGIIVHELSHAVACLLMGAKITEISFFSEEGGHVTHAKARVPLIGQPIISMAPMFGIPLFMFGLALLFGYLLGCWFPASYPHVTSAGSLWDYCIVSFDLFKYNFWVEQNWWFILYIYLTLTLVVCLSPSGQDLKNSFIGIAVVFGLGLGVIFVSGYLDWGTPVLRFLIKWLYYGLGLGFVLEIIATLITLPLFIVVWMIRRRAT